MGLLLAEGHHGHPQPHFLIPSIFSANDRALLYKNMKKSLSRDRQGSKNRDLSHDALELLALIVLFIYFLKTVVKF